MARLITNWSKTNGLADQATCGRRELSNKVEFLSGKKVKSTFSFRRNAESPRYAKEITFDFSGLNEHQILELALKSVQIRAQAMHRSLDPSVMLNSESLAEIDVLKDIVTIEKRAADPTSKAIRSLMQATGCDETTARQMMTMAQQKAEARKTEGQKGKKAA